MKVRRRSRPCSRAKAAASSTFSPCRMTSAPCLRVFTTFTVGVLTGMTMVADAKTPRAVGDALRMVPRRHGDHAPPALLVRQRGKPVDGAALLEGRRELQVLELQPDRAAQHPRERAARRVGLDDLAEHALAGGLDGFERHRQSVGQDQSAVRTFELAQPRASAGSPSSRQRDSLSGSYRLGKQTLETADVLKPRQTRRSAAAQGLRLICSAGPLLTSRRAPPHRDQQTVLALRRLEITFDLQDRSDCRRCRGCRDRSGAIVVPSAQEGLHLCLDLPRCLGF